MSKNFGSLLIGLLVVLVVLSGSMFTVDQRQNALVFQLGEVVSVKKTPGLYFKMPLVQNVRYFDTRILTLDAADPERFITSEKKNVLVDSFIKWCVIDSKQFLPALLHLACDRTIRIWTMRRHDREPHPSDAIRTRRGPQRVAHRASPTGRWTVDRRS